MTMNITGAVQAYDKMLRQGGAAGMEARDSGGADFSEMLRRAAERAADTMVQGENQTVQAAAGTADMTEVVMAAMWPVVSLVANRREVSSFSPTPGSGW